jgi:hypothetical protein
MLPENETFASQHRILRQVGIPIRWGMLNGFIGLIPRSQMNEIG